MAGAPYPYPRGKLIPIIGYRNGCPVFIARDIPFPHGIEGKAFLERESAPCLILRCGCGGFSSFGPTDEGPAITCRVAHVSLDGNGAVRYQQELSRTQRRSYRKSLEREWSLRGCCKYPAGKAPLRDRDIQIFLFRDIIIPQKERINNSFPDFFALVGIGSIAGYYSLPNLGAIARWRPKMLGEECCRPGGSEAWGRVWPFEPARLYRHLPRGLFPNASGRQRNRRRKMN